MEKRYINADRYKKTARTKNRKRKIVKTSRIVSDKNIQKKNKSSQKKYKVKTGKLVRFIFCFILLVIIAIVARGITREENEPFIPVFFNNEVVENVDSINIAVYTNANIGTNNVVITELEQYIYPMLLRINSNYEIEYDVISSINKINNGEYDIVVKQNTGITSVDVKDTIDRIINEKNKYYYKVENVDKVEIKSETELKVTLKNDDEYYVFNLNIPIYKEIDSYGIYKVESSTENKLSLVRKDNANKEYYKNINVIKLLNEEEATKEYKEGNIDVFFSSSKNSIKMLGKYEYDIKSYNTGEGLFILFNPNSSKTKDKNTRQMIAYSINREEILSEVASDKGKIIDLPYIYDEQKYKYDVYAADNIILSNGYTKQGLYYIKNAKKLTFELIVNKDDEEKKNVANKIKNELLKAGIDLIVLELSNTEITSRINSGNYDMILASVYINENPNINHLRNSICITNSINEKMDVLKTDTLENININISNLKNVLSEEIAIYGIYSNQTYIIYKKGIELFKNINYNNLFGEYFNKEVTSNELQQFK